MEQDEIIEMAKQAGLDIGVWEKLYDDDLFGYSVQGIHENLEAFAKLVEDAAFVRWAAQTKLAVQEEREACAKLCDNVYEFGPEGEWCAHAIRAGEHMRGTNE